MSTYYIDKICRGLEIVDPFHHIDICTSPIQLGMCMGCINTFIVLPSYIGM
jgi:hypothetical protein